MKERAIQGTAADPGPHDLPEAGRDSCPVPHLGRLLAVVLSLSASLRAHAQEQPIRWSDLSGFAASATTLTKTAPDGWTARGVSVDVLGGGVDGYVEFGIVETNTRKVAGLSQRSIGGSPEEINFGVQTLATGSFEIVENGVIKFTGGALAQSDRFRVSLVGTSVQYRQNGEVVYTSAAAVTSASRFQFAVSAFTHGAVIDNPVAGGGLAEGVVWTGHVKASSSGNTLWKTTTPGVWDAEGISTRAIDSPDGYLEVSASLSPTVAMVGLSNGNSNANHPDIDYALYMSGGTLLVYEGGVSRGSFGTLASTDRLRVSVEGGVVKYRKNGALLYTSTMAPIYPLLVDTSLLAAGSTIQGAVLSGTLVSIGVSRPAFSVGSGLYAESQTVTITGEAGSTIHYTTNGADPTESDPVISSGSSLLMDIDATLKAKAWAPGLLPSGTTAAIYKFGTAATEDVVWTAHVKTASSGNTLWKTTTPGVWDAEAISTRAIDSPDGYLEVSASLSPTVAMVGLSNGNSNANHPDIDYALYMSGGTLLVYEGGVSMGSFGPLAVTDKLRVSVESGVVKYRKNGTLLYTSTVAPVYPLLVDTSLLGAASTIQGAVLSGTLVNVAVSRPVFSVGSGLYSGSQTVTITGEADSTIHYTTNGADPTESDPVITSGSSLLIEVDTTLKAKAWTAGLLSSGTTAAIYKFGTAVSEDVVWTGHVKTASSGNTVWKTTTSAVWDAEGLSTKGINSPDGYLEVSASLSPTVAMVGLSNGNSNAGHPDIDYALYMSGGTLLVYEGGVSRGSFGTVTVTDKLRVSVEGGVVTYRKNGTLLYTSTMAPIYPLLVDTSLLAAASTIQGAVLSGTLVSIGVSRPAFSVGSGLYAESQTVTITGEAGSTIHYTTNGADPTESDPVISSGSSLLMDIDATLKAKAWAPGLLPSGTTAAIYKFGTAATEDVVWTAHVKTASSGNALWKTTTPAVWDAEGISTKAISSPDGYLEVSASLSPTVAMVGLSNGNSNANHPDIDYALYMSSGTLLIYEGGVSRGSFGALTGTDKLRVSVEGGVVKYRKNGTLLYTSRAAPVYPLLVDTSLLAAPSTIQGAVLSGVLVDSRTPAPSFTPPAGTYDTALNVALQAVPGSVIRFTTDGSDPTSSSPIYSTPIPIALNTPTTVKAIATATGYLQSVIGAASYTFAAAPPTFTPAAGPYLGPLLVTATSSTPSATIHYTFNGGDPSSSSPSVPSGGTISIPVSGTLKGIALAPGLATSAMTTGVYELVAAEPLISPNGGSFTAPVEVTLTAGAGASIFYTIDGSTPDETKTQYTGPFTLSASATLKARAFVTGWTPSNVSEAAFEIATDTPFDRRLWVNATNVVLQNAAGEAWAWGGNGSGQLGTGDSEFVLPVRTPTFDEAADLSSWNHTVWLNSAGAAQAIGANDLGQADGVPSGPLSSPVSVAGLPPLKKVRAGWGFTMALAGDGSIWVWGDNSAGQHGLGHLDSAPAPTQVPGLSGMIDIQVSFAGLVALRSDGVVFTWGGEVDPFGPVSSPVQVGSLPAIQSLNQGVGPFTGIDGQGRVWVWGQNQWSVSQPPSLVHQPHGVFRVLRSLRRRPCRRGGDPRLLHQVPERVAALSDRWRLLSRGGSPGDNARRTIHRGSDPGRGFRLRNDLCCDR